MLWGIPCVIGTRKTGATTPSEEVSLVILTIRDGSWLPQAIGMSRVLRPYSFARDASGSGEAQHGLVVSGVKHALGK